MIRMLIRLTFIHLIHLCLLYKGTSLALYYKRIKIPEANFYCSVIIELWSVWVHPEILYMLVILFKNNNNSIFLPNKQICLFLSSFKNIKFDKKSISYQSVIYSNIICFFTIGNANQVESNKIVSCASKY